MQRLIREIRFQRNDGTSDASSILRKKIEWLLLSDDWVCDLTKPTNPPIVILSELENDKIHVDVFRFDTRELPMKNVYAGKAVKSLARPALDRSQYRVECDGWIITLYC